MSRVAARAEPGSQHVRVRQQPVRRERLELAGGAGEHALLAEAAKGAIQLRLAEELTIITQLLLRKAYYDGIRFRVQLGVGGKGKCLEFNCIFQHKHSSSLSRFIMYIMLSL
ncbi:hypothetical protein [Paenibacillus hexagrammi]|uniref:Uncharacterized protein n=1 Tax=Paenibacillus hexagrammi TaxID=2908839 RepID=A0ABY3SS95_9BACL|nr:hypothetical protein [Paenibacillus sp. YPD9-1]UJF36529.1 hypothetical protein L0M14_04140 [Paenibacillus sp. YPD9-1]